MAGVNGGGHSDDVEGGFLEVVCVGREGDVTPFKPFSRNFFGGVFAAAHHLHSSFMDVESDHADVFGKRQGDGQANVAQSDHRHGGFLGHELIVQRAHRGVISRLFNW